jgi:DNA processing protein
MSTSPGRTEAPTPEPRRRAWLALLRAPGIGPATLAPLLAASPDPATWFERPPAAATEPLRRYLASPDWDGADRDLAWLSDAPDRHLVTLEDPRYPQRLRREAAPPVALFVVGDPDLLGWPQLAIVGSRNASRGGLENAREFARELAGRGLAITSGLALGIDGAAHQGALDAGGLTLAVAGTGLDRVYPARHRDLAHAIRDAGGALVSEFPPGTAPRPGNFPRRNRIISGLSLGTLVVEAALRSGSLITARQALERGREVFAIPGSIHNPTARGCHALIREGAKLVECAEHVLEELGSLLEHPVPAPGIPGGRETETPVPADPEHTELLEAMGWDPVSVDVLVARTGQPPQAVASMLLLLELEGHVSSSAGGLYTRERASQA